MTSPYSPTSFPGSSLMLHIYVHIRLKLKVSFPHRVGEAFDIALNFFYLFSRALSSINSAMVALVLPWALFIPSVL